MRESIAKHAHLGAEYLNDLRFGQFASNGLELTFEEMLPSHRRHSVDQFSVDQFSDAPLERLEGVS